LATTWTEPPRDWTGGELVTEAMADAHIRDQFKATWHCIAKKNTDESVVSSAVMQDDNDLFIPAVAGEVWRFDADLIFDGATAGDFTWRWTFPGGSLVVKIEEFTLSDGSTSSQMSTRFTTSPTGAQASAGFAAGDPRLMIIHCFYTASSTGNLQFQWAQFASSGTPTILRAGSAFYGMKLV
jgi:hypothetical protein